MHLDAPVTSLALIALNILCVIVVLLINAGIVDLRWSYY